MAEYWEALVPLPQSALDTIADGAYYSLLVRDKLRVLSFNSDYGSVACTVCTVKPSNLGTNGTGENSEVS